MSDNRQLEAFDRIYASLRAEIADIRAENVRLDAENRSLVASLNTANDTTAKYRIVAKSLREQLAASDRCAREISDARDHVVAERDESGKICTLIKAELDRYRAAEKARAVDPVDLGTLLDEFKRTLFQRWNMSVIDLASSDEEWRAAREAIVTAWQARPPVTSEDVAVEHVEPVKQTCYTCRYEMLDGNVHPCDSCTDIETDPTNWTPREPERQPGDVWCERWPRMGMLPSDVACKTMLNRRAPGQDAKMRGIPKKISRCRDCGEMQTEPDAEPQPETPDLPPLSEEMIELLSDVVQYHDIPEPEEIRLYEAIRRLEANQLDPEATCGDCGLFTGPALLDGYRRCYAFGGHTYPKRAACVRIEREPKAKEKTDETT